DSVPNRFVTICMGKAMSCGAILLSHGDIRWCGHLSRIMIHNVSAGTWGDAYEMKAASEETMRLNNVFMDLLAKNCGKTYDEDQDLIRKSTSGKEIWLDANPAFDFGIVDTVGTQILTPTIHHAADIAPHKQKLTYEDRRVNRKKRSSNKRKVKTPT